MGYEFRFQQEAVDLEIFMQNDVKHVRAGKRSSNVLLNQEKESIENIEHNKKISSLIKNMYANGRSEFTNAEAVAKVFVADVLTGDCKEGHEKWLDFLKRARRGDIIKDNRTVFRWGENNWVSVFRALNIYIRKDRFDLPDKEEIIEKALDFYFIHGDHAGKLDFDKIVIFNYCSIDSHKIFIKILNYFLQLQITGNMNREKAYRSFLKEYTLHAYKWGYLRRPDFFRLELPVGGYSKRYSGLLKEYLEENARQVEWTMKEGLYPTQGREELELVKAFFEKNIEVVESSAEAGQTRMGGTATVKMMDEYTDEKVYEELNQYAKKNSAADVQVTEDEFTAKLEKYYCGGKLNLHEYRELLEKFRKNTRQQDS